MTDVSEYRSQCFDRDCTEDSTRLCGVCDGWFCDAHWDHGPLGDAGHQGGREIETVVALGELSMDPGYEMVDRLVFATAAEEISDLRQRMIDLEAQREGLRDAVLWCRSHLVCESRDARRFIRRIDSALKATETRADGPDHVPASGTEERR